MSLPTISLCVIARDEAELLPRMIASARACVDEIIVVDTGSTDATAKVAAELGAKVIHHPFQDDFSDARNRSLEAATSDWILVLDADETLDPKGCAAIRDAVRDPSAAGYYLPFDNLRDGGRVQRCAMLRLFRRADDVRFDYVIHEQVYPSLDAYRERRDLTLTLLPDVTVTHDGYLPSRYEAKQKKERNLRLFRIQVRVYPDHVYSWYKFGDFLRRFAEHRDEALDALGQAVKLLRATPDAEARRLAFPAEIHALLGVELDKRGATNDAFAAVVEGMERFDPTPNLLYVHAHLLAKLGRDHDSFVSYAKLRQFDGKTLATPPDPGVTGAVSYAGMGRALDRLGHAVAAIRCYERALEIDPGFQAARLPLARVLLKQGSVDVAVGHYRQFLSRDPDRHEARLQLATLLLHTGASAAAEAEFASLLDHVDPTHIATGIGQARFAQGDFEGALELFAQLPDDPNCLIGVHIITRLVEGVDPSRDAEIPATQRGLWQALLRQSGVLTAINASA